MLVGAEGQRQGCGQGLAVVRLCSPVVGIWGLLWVPPPKNKKKPFSHSKIFRLSKCERRASAGEAPKITTMRGGGANFSLFVSFFGLRHKGCFLEDCGREEGAKTGHNGYLSPIESSRD